MSASRKEISQKVKLADRFSLHVLVSKKVSIKTVIGREDMTTQKDSANGDQDKLERTPSHYDPHLIPSETAAREAREGTRFAQVEHDNAEDIEHIHTRDGYTIDPEGLINNYAVEPPMYVNEPGDLSEAEGTVAQQRAAERRALSKDEEGNLSPKTNWQHKGPGMI